MDTANGDRRRAVALMKNGDVIGMGIDEADACADARLLNGPGRTDPADVEDAERVEATPEALAAWSAGHLDLVTRAPNGAVHRIDVDDVPAEDKGTPNDPAWYSDAWDPSPEQPPAPREQRVRGFYRIRTQVNLGADTILTRHLTLAEARNWDDSADPCEVVSEVDGLPECGHVLGLAGGAGACECGRPDCPDATEPASAGPASAR